MVDNPAILGTPERPDLHLLCLMYEKSQDSAEHSDSLLWEVTAIIWSASALLIGFIVEVLRTDASPGQRVIVCFISLLTIFLTWVAHRIMRVANTMMNLKYEICRDIEGRFVDLPENLRQHRRADHLFEQNRWKGGQKRLYFLVSLGFTVVWASVFFVSGWRWVCVAAQRLR